MEISLHWFTNPRFVWICAGFLALLALVTAVTWWIRSRQAMVALSRARGVLAGCSGQTEFFADFHGFDERIRAALESVKVFGDGWERWTGNVRSVE